MRFLLLLLGDEAAEATTPEDELRQIIEAHGAFGRRLRERGAYVLGEALQPSPTVKTVRRAEGDVVSDGPYAETKEQLGGLYVVDCADLQEALGYAREVPLSPGLVVQVWPVASVD